MVSRSAVDSTHLVLLSLRRYVYLDLGLAIRNDLSLMVVERGCFIACGAVASQPFLARLLCSVLLCLVGWCVIRVEVRPPEVCYFLYAVDVALFCVVRSRDGLPSLLDA